MKIIEKHEVKIDTDFAAEIQRLSGENVYLCYQCRKCSSGCPGKEYMQAGPADLMRYIQLGMKEKALQGPIIWACMSCQTCTARCPQDIDIAAIVDALKIIAQEQKVKTDTKGARLFNWLWMTILTFTGRMYEVVLTGGLNTLRGNPFKDIKLGMKMIKNGKLKLLPSIKRPIEMFKMFARARRARK